MKCSICKQGETFPGQTTVTLTRGGTTVIIKDVPAEVCCVCGEYYLFEKEAKITYEIAEQAVQRNEEVTITRYAA